MNSNHLLNTKKGVIIEGSWFSWLKIILFYSTIIFIFFHDSIIPKFTPVSTLAHKIHENSRYKFNGARCIDGWISKSQGEGTCSYHSGVNYYFYEGEYAKDLDECYEEAKKLSWLK